MGHMPECLVALIRAVLCYDHPKDEEAQELQETIHAEGDRSALARYAGIEEDHPLVGLVAEQMDRSREQG